MKSYCPITLPYEKNPVYPFRIVDQMIVVNKKYIINNGQGILSLLRILSRQKKFYTCVCNLKTCSLS